MKNYILLFLVAFTLNVLSNPKTDSLFSELKKWQGAKGISADTNLYTIYYKLGLQLLNANPDTAVYYFKLSITKAKNTKDDIRQAESLRQIGRCYALKGNFNTAESHYKQSLALLNKYQNVQDSSLRNKALKVIAGSFGYMSGVYMNNGKQNEALEYLIKAQKINERVKNKEGLMSNYSNIGTTYYSQGRNALALEYYFKALKITDEIGNKYGQANALANIANVYQLQEKYEKALDYYFKSLKIKEEIADKSGQANNLGNIGRVYLGQKDYDKALDYYFKSYEINKSTNNISGQSINLENIGFVYALEEKYEKAIDYFFKALKINREVGDKTYEASILGNIGKVYFKQNKYKEAENYLQQSIKINIEINSVYDLSFQYETLSELYQKINQPQKALDAYKKYVEAHDTLNSEENRKASFQKEMLYEFDKKQTADSIKVAEQRKLSELKFSEEKKRNRLILILGSGVLAIVIAFAAFVYNRLKISQKQKQMIQNQRDLVQEQKNLVEQQKLIVDEKQKEILDSIKYAKRIQQAMLPSEKFINRKLKKKE